MGGVTVVIATHFHRWWFNDRRWRIFTTGSMSRVGVFQLLYAESFRDMSNGERAKFIVEASGSINLVILGVLSGILLFLISWFVTKTF